MERICFLPMETERLVLRAFKELDAEPFFRYRTNPQVILYQGEGWSDYSIEKAIGFVKNNMDAAPGIPGTWFQVAIEQKETGRLIGDCGIHTLSEDPKQVEIGFTLDPEYQKQGYAVEAVRCLLTYLFHELNMHRVIGIVDVRNGSSIQLLEKLGMRKEGSFIQNSWNKGAYTDEYYYGMLKREWNG